MGNQHAKAKSSRFTDAEMKALEASFRSCGNHADKLLQEKLLASWSSIIDHHLAERTSDFLFSTLSAATTSTSSTQQQQQQQLQLQQHQNRITSINVCRFAEPYYVMERGTLDEKLLLLAGSMVRTDTNQFAVKELENYVASVLKSYLRAQETQKLYAAFNAWSQHGYHSTERSILAFAKGMTRSLDKANQDEHHFYMEQLERWLQINPTFLKIWREVFIYMYSKPANKTNASLLGSSHDGGLATTLLPALEGLVTGTNYTPILDVPHLIFINSNLPNEHRHKWRFLFSSKTMGESFSTMLGKIQNRGPTLFIVEDEDRYIFGGYAPESWSLRPNFVGNETSMLLTLSPAMRCFGATGYNNHYQYLNLNQQTMPNGLGMGGQFNYWGFWLDSEYGLGQSCESCTTYRDYVQLSKRKEFRIRNLEVWGIGDEPKSGDDSDDEHDVRTKPSILDKNMEDRVMLELSGRDMHSDGLREPGMD